MAAQRAAGLIDQAASVAPTRPAVHGWLYEHGGRQWLALQDGIGAGAVDAAKSGWQTSVGGMAWGLTHGQRIDPHKLPDVLDPVSQAQRLTAAARQSVDADD